jgi:hypothetical protein
MKALILLVSAFCFSIATYAQNLTVKTNDIHLKLADQRGEVVMPVIKWISPAMEYTNSTEKKVKFTAIIESPVPIAVLSFVATKTSGQVLGTKNFAAAEGLMKFEISEELVIPDGDNLISIEVETKSGGKVSSNRHILVGMDAVSNAVAIDRKDYAIFFATDKYDNWGDLVNPVFDSHTIADELRENFGFEVEVIENPTPEIVFEKILEYSQKTYKPQDQLMVFFAGHGHFDEAFGEGYIVATNSLSNDPSRTSYISHNRLRSVINNIPTQHTLLVMDACFGGYFRSTYCLCPGFDHLRVGR